MVRAAFVAAVLAFPAFWFDGVSFPLSQEQVGKFVESPFAFVVGATRGEVEKRFGRPKKYDRTLVRNPHNHRLNDVIEDLQYDDLDIRLGTFPGASPPSIGLISVSITAQRWPLKYGLRVGSPKRQVQRVLRWPEAGYEMSTWKYQDESGNWTLEFTFRQDRVARIDWSNEWD